MKVQPLLTALSLALITALNGCSDSKGGEPRVSMTTPVAAAASATPALSPTPPAAPAIPARYQPVAAELNTALADLEKTLPAGQPKISDVGVVSTSLIMANSNSGPAILRPAVLDSVNAYLDQLAKMGSSGVEVQISYPVGSKDFPNQAAYVAFYKSVVQAAHQRGFKVLIETSCIFSNSPFTDVQFDFSKLTPTQYFQARTDEIVTIAREIRPDYLALGEEPVNERVFAGINYTPDQYVAFVNSAAAAVRAALGADAGAVKVGVGAGTWEFDLFQSFIKQTDLDFYDIHIYPLQGNPGGLETAREMARLAQAKGKPSIIGETWLYKMAASEIGQTAGASAADAFRRDAFSFWEPLDARYMRDVLALGAEFKMPFVSFWGARFFFGQLEWTTKLDALDFRGVSNAINPTLAQNITSGRRGPLGDAFAQLMGR